MDCKFLGLPNVEALKADTLDRLSIIVLVQQEL
jgi:hypothetical protein